MASKNQSTSDSKMRKPKRVTKVNQINSRPKVHMYTDSSSTSGSQSQAWAHQEHGRVRIRHDDVSHQSSSTSESFSGTSIDSSLTRFRGDFEDLKCKMIIFGESLSLCNCIAEDFKNKLGLMEKRLELLERRHRVSKSESNNYTAIIQKNKKLSNKTLQDAKKLQICGSESEMREVAGRICRNYLHGAWKTVDPQQLNFRKMSGGLSNFLYYVALPDEVNKLSCYAADASPDSEKKNMARVNSFCIEEPKKVLLRIYGQVHGERAVDAIVTESVIFTLLSERRLGPKLYGVFSGGRIEEYIPARALCNKELSDPAISMKIAEKMAAIHSMDVPLSKEPNWLWKTTGKWWKTTKEDRWLNTVGKTEEEKRILKLLKSIDFDKELEWLKKYTATVQSPIVFCHNDMQEGNILILEDQINSEEEDYTSSYSEVKSDKENNHRRSTNDSILYDENNTSDDILSYTSDNGEPRLVLIDFEYCAYNHRAFDIANHFQEWGYEYTNTEFPYYFENQENCPTLEQKEIFMKEYLKHYHSNLDKEPPTIDDVNQLFTEVEAFELVSHLFWCLWTTNSSTSQIPFGYWEYAISRYERYRALKQEVIKKDKLGMPHKRKICEVDI